MSRPAAAVAGLMLAAGCSCGGGAAASQPPVTGTNTPPAVSSAPPATAATTTLPRLPLAGRVIQIDPGHNPGNWRFPAEIDRPVPFGPPGQTKPCDTTGTATASGYPEAVYNLAVAIQVLAILRREGARVVITPVQRLAWGPCITTRAAIGNSIHADAAVSIHADGEPAAMHGFFVIVPSAPIPAAGLTAAMIADDDRLGAAMLRAFHSVTEMPISNLYPTGYLRSDAYGGTDLSQVPKIFIETGNMANSGDAALFESAAFRHRAAVAIAAGIRLFLTGRMRS